MSGPILNRAVNGPPVATGGSPKGPMQAMLLLLQKFGGAIEGIEGRLTTIEALPAPVDVARLTALELIVARLSEDQISDEDFDRRIAAILDYNPNHDPHTGEFSTGGGSRKERIKATARWLRDTPAQEIISKIAGSPKTKEVLTFAIGSLIAHGFASAHTGGGFWYAEPHLEHDIETMVHNFSVHANVTAGRAKEMIRQAVSGLKDLRSKVSTGVGGKSNTVIAADDNADMLPSEEHLQALLDALDRYDPGPEDA